jgi:Mg-chelatase subunit ChlI
MNDVYDKLDDAADPTAIVGHSDFTNALAGALASGRMHHAWLLTGPRGIGKASMARLAAAWLLSEQAAATGLFGDATPQFAVSPNDPWRLRQFLTIINQARSKLIKSAIWFRLWRISRHVVAGALR